MKSWTKFMLAACVAAATTACAGDRAGETARDESAKPADPGAVGTAGAAKADPNREAGMTDRNFVEDMAAGGRAEVELAKLAQQKASNKQVKTFAAMLARDHTKAGDELKTVATQANIDLSTIDTEEGKDERDRLAKLSGGEFDREYIKMMVDKHEKTVNDVEGKAERSDNDHVKQWAAKTLPTLKKHLEEARQIQDTLEKRKTT
jgi:putative membrane protein